MLPKIVGGILALSIIANISLWTALRNEAARGAMLRSEIEMLTATNRAADNAISAKEHFRREIAKSLQDKREKLSHVDESVEDDSLFIGDLLDVLGVYKPARSADKDSPASIGAAGRKSSPASAGGHDE